MQIPAAGGTPQPFTELDKDKGEITHRWPQWLPDGRAVIFTSNTNRTDFEKANIEIFIVATGERKVIQQNGTFGHYVALDPASGVVVYASGGSLFGVPFDVEALEVTGSAVPLVENVTVGAIEGSSQYSASLDGTLVYGSGKSRIIGHSLSWIDRDGNVEPLWEEEHFTRNPSISPDGTRIAVDMRVEGQFDIWVYDIARGVPTRLTFDSKNEQGPVWSPNGEYIYYSMDVEGVTGIFRKPSDGSGEAESVFLGKFSTRISSISADGARAAVSVSRNSGRVALLPLDAEDPKPEMLTQDAFGSFGPKFSPNGRWLLYTSLESGRAEIYVRAVEGRGKWQVSSGGGNRPQWSRDGKEIFFRSNGATNVVEVETEGPNFRAGRDRKLWDNRLAEIGFADPFDVAPDGQRMVAVLPTGAELPEAHQHLSLVLNWGDELRATFGD